MNPWTGTSRSPGQRGFTLLELLVAMAVFGVVAVMAYGGLRAVLDARQHTDRASRALAELQMAFSLLGRDLEQVLARPVRDEYGDVRAPLRFSPFSDQPRLDLVRAGGPSGLQRVAWEVREERLYRLYWSGLDGVNPAEPQGVMPVVGADDAQQPESAVLAVRGWSLRFHHTDETGAFAVSETWPLEISPGAPETLPRAVELTLELADGAQLTRWYVLP